MSKRIFFAHANGFPCATYTKLFEALAPEYEVLHLELHGHDPRFPVDDNWTCLVEELAQQLRRLDEPVWGVGHSMGGILHYHTALRYPQFYRGVVMLDSPVPTWLDQAVIWLAKRLGFIDRITPAGRTLGRRDCFADPQQAYDYFAGKGLFRDFDPDCLAAYVEHGLQPSEAGYRLRFDPQTEIDIYRSVPHITPGWPPALRVPLAMVRGEHSDVVMPHHAYLLRLMPRGQALSMPGGHMFPLERPLETASMLRRLLAQWRQAEPVERCA